MAHRRPGLMTRLFRPHRTERGQAMPLAAIGMFVMVLGVLATLQLGTAVYQKIKLQNTADAAAYTLAAMEARTFNYIAFLNRAQIAHYNTAMMVQSYMTWAGFQVAMYGTAVDTLNVLKQAIDIGCSFPYPANVLYCAAKAYVTAYAKIATQLRDAAVRLYKSGHDVGHKIVEAMSIFNKATLWQSQLARAALLNVHILTGMQNYIEKHDPDISFKNGRSVLLNLLVNMALNSIEYYQAFDNASGMNPFVYGLIADIRRVSPNGAYTKHSDTKGEDAYRLMTELCHATRTPKFVSNRQGMATKTAVLANLFGPKLGQTKFTKDRQVSSAEIKGIGTEKNYEVGDTLSSDDFLKSGGGFATGPPAPALAVYTAQGQKLGDAIAAYEDQGKHFLYKGNGESGLPAPGKKVMIGIPGAYGGPKDTMETKSGKAPWPGFAPYFKFKPNKDRTADFGQPSTWIFLNKSHKDWQSKYGSHSKEQPWYSKWTWTMPTGDGKNYTFKLDTTVGGKRNSYLFEGLNVISRGMAYYHRPDNWIEHPNFFNPFWRARLAPVGQKLQSFWDRWVTSKITTKSDSAIVKGMVALLRNAQMDMFTAIISSIITH